MESGERLTNHIEKKREKSILIYVKYRDHVLFKNCDPSKLKPCIRKVVGWLSSESSEALVICSDMAAEPLLHEKTSDDGCIILKSDVLDMRKISSGKPFKRNNVAYPGLNIAL